MDHQQIFPSGRGGGGGGGNNILRAAVLAAVMVVLGGYLLVWVMMPTTAYFQTWLPLLRAKTATTYFGTTQGATCLVFTSPVLFVALLGCVYLHFGSASVKGGAKVDERVQIWRRPMIIKGLGIVSRIELAFFLMFMALLAWNLAAYLRNSFAAITPKSAAKLGLKLWEIRLDTAALRLGLVGNIALTFLFFPVTRGSSVLPLFGLTSEASVKYHIWLGHIVMTFFTAHGVCYVVFWASTNQISEMLEWKNTGISNVAGELSLLAGLVLWAATFPRIRRKMFELFFYTHHLYILFIIFFVLHVGISYAFIMLPGFLLFLIDRYLRFLQSRRSIRLISARLLPCEAMELNFSKSKSLSYTPMSVMFVNVPSLSKLQWHPFTITSSTNLESDKISVMIKGEGSWTRKLYESLGSSPSLSNHLNVSVEGPYGPSSTHFLRHDVVVMISGGSGITPFISIIRELVYTSEILKCKIPKLLLIASFKKSVDLTMLDLILPISGIPTDLITTGLQIEAFVTREKQPNPQQKKPIQTIWFKSNPSDVPLTPVLGRDNNWLWLGAIITSSFTIYLISIGILTRYYIYPIDHNTNRIYSSAARGVLHMLFLCIGIVIAATIAFLWNKNNSAKETNQIRTTEGPTPMATPDSSCYNVDRELESFPQQSLLQCIQVHYGGRPDFKKYLLDRKEGSVGVLASGPKQLRHDVARICSSSLASNLHFESISFSW
ncbi:ferric reduction oxidase 2-like [Andrographis paniculata]|uniref:ferric reduction oxidase 2-like n=1 Tax=Andrographis paniculata TaxID=175694 RepID=UPI0021E86A09|nr:ferric reduction oxidase 2-like [Andrographis paniculata]